VAELTAALNAEGTKMEACELVRSLPLGICLIPEGSGLAIELTGEMPGLLALGVFGYDKTPAQGAGSVGRITLVAGGRIWTLANIKFPRSGSFLGPALIHLRKGSTENCFRSLQIMPVLSGSR